MAVHGLQDPVVSGLEGQMELLGDLLMGGHGVEELVAGIPGMGGHKPQGEFPLQLRDPAQQICKVDIHAQVLAVGVDVLPQDSDFLIARGDQLPALGQDVLRQTAPLPAPDVGDDAVGAEVVAAVHDGDPGLQIVGADHRQTLGNGPGGILHRPGLPVPDQHPVEVLRQLPQVVGRENAVHVGVAVLHAAGDLGIAHHAAADEDLLAGMPPFGVDQGSHVAEDPLHRVVPDGAGVDDHQIRPLGGVGKAVAAAVQDPPDLLGIRLVLLAAVGLHIGRRGDSLALPPGFDIVADLLLPAQVLGRNQGCFPFQIAVLRFEMILLHNNSRYYTIFPAGLQGIFPGVPPLTSGDFSGIIETVKQGGAV